MRRRAGWTLVEMLIVVGILAVMVGLTGPMFYALCRETPLAYEAVQADRGVRRMLRRLRDDVDAATAVTGGGRVVRLDGPRGAVSYEFAPDEVTRRSADSPATAGADAPAAAVWPARGARVDVALHRRGGRAVGIEVRTAIERRFGGRVERKLANAQVFFLGGAAAEGSAR